MISRPDISHIIIIGDSLTDRGTMYNRKLSGFIPMSLIAGLAGKSPDDSFTNGYPWSYHFVASLANKFTIQKFRNDKHWRNDDIADAIINKNIHLKRVVDNYYNYCNDKEIDYPQFGFLRGYAEGGLTSHSYKGKPSYNLERFITRLIVSTLEEKRTELLMFDSKHPELLTPEEKAKTLIIEWTGANDLITVNARPSAREADLAIAERIKNVEILIAQGYRHFVLINLPDFSLTPRYSMLSDYEREVGSRCAHYFNCRLNAMCIQTQTQYPDCTITVIDVNMVFANMCQHPEAYHLDKSKVHQAYIKSKDFRILPNGTSVAPGYLFWDDIHPTSNVHAILALLFSDKLKDKFNFIPPDSNLRKHAPMWTRSCEDLSLNSSDTFAYKHHNEDIKKHHFSKNTIFFDEKQSTKEEDDVIPIIMKQHK